MLTFGETGKLATLSFSLYIKWTVVFVITIWQKNRDQPRLGERIALLCIFSNRQSLSSCFNAHVHVCIISLSLFVREEARLRMRFFLYGFVSLLCWRNGWTVRSTMTLSLSGILSCIYSPLCWWRNYVRDIGMWWPWSFCTTHLEHISDIPSRDCHICWNVCNCRLSKVTEFCILKNNTYVQWVSFMITKYLN